MNSLRNFDLGGIFIIAIMFCFSSVRAQVVMFDDFTYSSVNDSALTTFNDWLVVDGTNGPPDGATYDESNISFASSGGNTLMTLKTTVDGATGAVTHSRIETTGYQYFEGTYAARVHFSDTPHAYADANIQTFYTIVSHTLAGDSSQYSEIDFEYMASDQWDGNASVNDQTMYMTSWNRYQTTPEWMGWRKSIASQQSYAGWHNLIFSCTDGVNVKFWIDGTYMGSVAYAQEDSSTVYPRSPMQVAFANWVWNEALGSSTAYRETEMQVDWVLFYEDAEVSAAQVDSLVSGYRAAGLQRRNLAGDTYYSTVSAFSLQIEAEDYDNAGGIAVETTSDTGGGQNVGWVEEGDWMYYGDHSIPASGYYLLELRLASPYSTGLVNIHFNEGGVTTDIGTYSVPNTGGWQNWTTVSDTVYIGAGSRSFGIYASSGGWNINWFRFTEVGGSSGRMTAENPRSPEDVALQVYPNPSWGQFRLTKELEWKVISGTGQIIKSGFGSAIDISTQRAGIYYVVTAEQTFRVMKR